jgi:hypothetical protein
LIWLWMSLFDIANLQENVLKKNDWKK